MEVKSIQKEEDLIKNKCLKKYLSDKIDFEKHKVYQKFSEKKFKKSLRKN